MPILIKVIPIIKFKFKYSFKKIIAKIVPQIASVDRISPIIWAERYFCIIFWRVKLSIVQIKIKYKREKFKENVILFFFDNVLKSDR